MITDNQIYKYFYCYLFLPIGGIKVKKCHAKNGF